MASANRGQYVCNEGSDAPKFNRTMKLIRDKSKVLRCWSDRRRPRLRDQPQDFGEEISRYRDLGQLKTDITAMADDFRGDLDQLSLQARPRPAFDWLGRRRRPREAARNLGEGMELNADADVGERQFGMRRERRLSPHGRRTEPGSQRRIFTPERRRTRVYRIRRRPFTDTNPPASAAARPDPSRASTTGSDRARNCCARR
jgi:hypothetical protein